MEPSGIALSFFTLVIWVTGWAQDTLPRFTVSTRGNNKVIISWTNKYSYVSQIAIQRSLDSTRNFKTILTVPDPKVSQNGFVDTKAITPYMFYRLFIVLDSGKYEFSRSKRPFWDTAKVKKEPVVVDKNPLPQNNRRIVISDSLSQTDVEILREQLKLGEQLKDSQTVDSVAEKFFSIVKRDSVIIQLAEKDFKDFRDSIVFKTRDTLLFKSLSTIVIKPFIPKEIYRPSRFIYTERDGNVTISLPDAQNKLYSIRFYEDDNTSLFEITRVKEPLILLDKSNFLHSGWFRFELFEDGKLKEKHKFFIPKDF